MISSDVYTFLRFLRNVGALAYDKPDAKGVFVKKAL
jgi:hypothetical protein